MIHQKISSSLLCYEWKKTWIMYYLAVNRLQNSTDIHTHVPEKYSKKRRPIQLSVLFHQYENLRQKNRWSAILIQQRKLQYWDKNNIILTKFCST